MVEKLDKEYLNGMDEIQKQNLDNLVERERGLFLLKLSELIENRIKVVQNALFEKGVDIGYTESLGKSETFRIKEVHLRNEIGTLNVIRFWIDMELSDIE